MGHFEVVSAEAGHFEYQVATAADGTPITGRAAWQQRYDLSKDWSSFNLRTLVGAFVEGGANFLTAIGIPLEIGISIIAVLVANFAATTLDTATRLQRYVFQELFGSTRATRPLAGKFAATGVAVGTAGLIAIFAGPTPGAGGTLLWPLFGAMNQLLAGLAMMVTAFYLWRRNKPIWFIALPMIGMLVFPALAMYWNLFSEHGYLAENKVLLSVLGIGVLILQAWMLFEAIVMWPKVKGVLEESLPPLPSAAARVMPEPVE